MSWAHHPPSSSLLRQDIRPNNAPAFNFGTRLPLSPQSLTHPNAINEFHASEEFRGFSSQSAGLLNAPFPDENEQSPASDVWAFAQSTPLLRGPTSPARGTDLPTPNLFVQKSPKWTENDFPPLRDMHVARLAFERDAQKWVDHDGPGKPDLVREESVSSEPPVSTISPAISMPPDAPGEGADSLHVRVASEPKVLLSSSEHDQICDPHYSSASSSPTPDPSLSPITPVTPKTTSTFLRTPRSSTGVIGIDDNASLRAYKSPGQYGTPRSSVDGPHPDENARFEESGKEVDRTTIFVGGLEMYGTNSWDEARLSGLFGKYGNIENIQLVRPRKSCTLADYACLSDIPSQQTLCVRFHQV